jgi:hypothetical protein
MRSAGIRRQTVAVATGVIGAVATEIVEIGDPTVRGGEPSDDHRLVCLGGASPAQLLASSASLQAGGVRLLYWVTGSGSRGHHAVTQHPL